MPGTRLQRRLWFAVALTLPLYALGTQRIVLGFGGATVTLAIPSLVVAVLIVMNVLNPKRPHGGPGRTFDGRLAVVLWLFLTWHIMSTLFAERTALALREDVKLFIGFACAWAPVRFMPRDIAFIQRFWKLAIGSSTLFFVVMIYRYMFVFHSSYLGGTYEAESRVNRNELTWFLMLVLPFALARITLERPRLRTAVPVVVLLFAFLYAGSRGTWISVLVGVIVALISTGKRDGVSSLRRIGSFAVIVLAVPMAWVLLQRVVANPEAVRRFQYVVNPSSVPELRSLPSRFGRAQSSLGLFLESPITGVGLTNDPLRADITGGDVSHNDYVGILSELGFIGFVLFVAALTLLVRRSWPTQVARGAGWIAFGTRASVVAILVSLTTLNQYTFTLLWLFFGLSMTTRSALSDQSGG